MRWIGPFAVAFAVFAAACNDAFDPDGAKSEFLSHARGAGEGHSRITYSGGERGLTVTLYLSGKIGRFRADINFENQEYSAFFDGDGEIWCAPDPGLILDGMESPSRDGACARESEAATGGSLVLMAFGPLFVPGAYTDVTITSKRRETILGQRADCYTEQLEETVDLEYCFSADSMLLRVGSNEAGLTLQRYEATQIEEATDQDFEPPYPIVDTE